MAARVTMAKMPLEGIAEDEREALDDSLAITSTELKKDYKARP